MSNSTAPKKPASKSAKTAGTKPKPAAKAKPAAKTAHRPNPAPPRSDTAASAMNGGAKSSVKADVTQAALKPLPLLQPKEKIKKPKLVRDSFTMPETEYQVLGEVKKACIKAGFEVKKSELLRVGVALIRKMDLAKLKDVLASLPPLKAGRPKKEK